MVLPPSSIIISGKQITIKQFVFSLTQRGSPLSTLAEKPFWQGPYVMNKLDKSAIMIVVITKGNILHQL